MAYSFPKYARNSNQTYGPTRRGHFYKPVDYHQPYARKRPDKTRWNIHEGNQYEVFRLSDEGVWECTTNKCLFSIIDNGNVILGENGERLGEFPFPPEPAIEWHGYPRPSDEIDRHCATFMQLLDKWENDGIITSHVRRKIEKGAI